MNIDQLLDKYSKFTDHIIAKDNSKLISLTKTHLSRNITIEDWNSMSLSTTQMNSDVNSILEFLYAVKDYLKERDDFVDTKFDEIVNKLQYNIDYETKTRKEEDIRILNEAKVYARDLMNTLLNNLNTSISNLTNVVNTKQNKLIAGDNIVIENDIIRIVDVATLDSSGKILSTYLPSYVDDVIEFVKFVDGASWKEQCINNVEIGELVYNVSVASDVEGSTSSPFYKAFVRNVDGTVDNLKAVKPESGKIYLCVSNNNTYRWSGSNLVEISKSLSLGETSNTAYAGNKGKKNAEDIIDLNNRLDTTRVSLVNYIDGKVDFKTVKLLTTDTSLLLEDSTRYKIIGECITFTPIFNNHDELSDDFLAILEFYCGATKTEIISSANDFFDGLDCIDGKLHTQPATYYKLYYTKGATGMNCIVCRG